MIVLNGFIRFALMLICVTGSCLVISAYLEERDTRGYSSPLYIVCGAILFGFFILLGAL
jgi:hypothetical protein